MFRQEILQRIPPREKNLELDMHFAVGEQHCSVRPCTEHLYLLPWQTLKIDL